MSRSGSRDESISRNFAFGLAAQLGTAAFTAGLTLFLVRMLGPAGYGVFALALGFSSLVLLPADFGVSHSSARFIAERRGDDRAVADVLVNALRVKLVLTSIFAALLFALAGPIASLYDSTALAWPLRGIALAVLGQSVTLLFMYSFVALGRLSYQFRLVVSESAIEVSASIALVLLAGGATAAAFGRAIGYGCGALLGVLLMVRLLGVRPFAERRGAPSTRELVGYAGALLIIDGVWAIFAQLQLLLVGGLLGTIAAGIYGAPAKLATFLHYPGLAMANAVAPRLARRPDGLPDVASLRRALRYVLVLQALLAAPIVVWAQPMVDVLLGPDYDRSAEVLRALVPFLFLQGFGPLVTLSINYFGEARRRIPIALGSLLLNVVLAIWLIESIGVVGAAIAIDVAFAFYVGAHLWLCRRLLGLELGPPALTAMRALLAAGAFVAVLLAIGTEGLTALDWALGATAGPLAFVLVLLASRELSVRELRQLPSTLARVLPGRSPV